MTVTDIIIVVILFLIVGSILYVKIKNRKQSTCAMCAYAPKKGKKAL